MLDLAIRNGMVVDGTGRKARRANVGIVDGRVVAVGELDDQASQVIDADGQVVCPGFVDVHTHYDAQLFWDPTFSPSPLHGVTTVIAGNCGISLAPVGPEDQEFVARLLSRVEAIPLESLAAGLSFRWQEFPEFLDVVESMDLMVNVGFLVGHSALRRFVMGESASCDTASKKQLALMVHNLDEAIRAGALGFSSSESSTQFDGEGRPTPPNFASDAELIALARVCGSHPGTSLEYVPVSAGLGLRRRRQGCDPDGGHVPRRTAPDQLELGAPSVSRKARYPRPSTGFGGFWKGRRGDDRSNDDPPQFSGPHRPLAE